MIHDSLKSPLPIGTILSRTLAVTGIGPVAKRCIQAITGRPCNCEKREKEYNAMGQTIYNAVVPQQDKPNNSAPSKEVVVAPPKPSCGKCGQK